MREANGAELRPKKISKLWLWHTSYTIWSRPRCLEPSGDVGGQEPDKELADGREPIWSGNTAAPQESANDGGSGIATTTPAHATK